MRKKSVRQKLNPIDIEFKGKNVLLVDDSIVRGTTSKQIIQMAREAGAKKVYIASAAPPVRQADNCWLPRASTVSAPAPALPSPGSGRETPPMQRSRHRSREGCGGSAGWSASWRSFVSWRQVHRDQRQRHVSQITSSQEQFTQAAGQRTCEGPFFGAQSRDGRAGIVRLGRPMPAGLTDGPGRYRRPHCRHAPHRQDEARHRPSSRGLAPAGARHVRPATSRFRTT